MRVAHPAEDPLTYTFPERVSATSRSLFTTCPQKWFWTYCTGLRGKLTRGIDLRAGGAFAKGLEVTRKCFFDMGAPAEQAIEAGVAALVEDYGENDYPDHKKNLHAMMGALYHYFTQWPIGSDYLRPFRFDGAGTGIEFRFAVPLPIEHPTLGQPLLYEGRVDMVAQRTDSNALWVVDEKTTGALGPYWRKKWLLDAQLTSYVWAAQQHGYSVAGAIIRGISILKNGYGTEEVPMPRTKYQIEDWYEQLLRDVERMVHTFEHFTATGRRPDRALDKDMCAAYGGCAFLDVCSSHDPNTWLRAMAMGTANAESPGLATTNVLDLF